MISAAFDDGQPIPVRYTPAGANVSPPLAWSGVPGNARELVLICEDPDAPRATPFVHWILHRLPAKTTSLPEGVAHERELFALGGASRDRTTPTPAAGMALARRWDTASITIISNCSPWTRNWSLGPMSRWMNW